MSGWNGFGVFTRVYSWVADANAGIDINASRMDTDTDNITANGFGNCLTRDGQGSATANLPMNAYKFTGLGDGSALGDSLSYGQPNATNGVGGTTTDDDAPAGMIGEYLENVATFGGMTSNVISDIGTISLTAGDWDVWANVGFSIGVGASMTKAVAWVNTVSAALPAVERAIGTFGGSINGTFLYQIPTGSLRVSIAATTTIYMSALSVFTGGSVSSQGVLMARRAR